uniref:HORMA domain-containing protein n=1 Tax=Panagrolaimus sp. ES5 TaxID=591445 RepID=A0AC34FJG4_9BILA
MAKKKQKDITDTLYPKGDKLKGKEVEYLTRSATLICSAYAYHRCILPSAAFKFVRIYESQNNPFFGSDHPKAKMHRATLLGMQTSIEEKKIKQFCFALCENNDPNNTVEALQFTFDYEAVAMDVLLPNATNVRVSTKWDFAVDLCEVLKRVRLLAAYLSALPTGLKPFIMIQYLKKPEVLPKDFKYLNDYDLDKMEKLPLARLPCDSHNMQMIVEIRSKYFVVAPDDIRKDVERGLEVDEDVSDSKDSTPPPKPSDFVPPGKDDSDDVRVVEDDVETPRDKRMDSPDYIVNSNEKEITQLISDPSNENVQVSVSKPSDDVPQGNDDNVRVVEDDVEKPRDKRMDSAYDIVNINEKEISQLISDPSNENGPEKSSDFFTDLGDKNGPKKSSQILSDPSNENVQVSVSYAVTNASKRPHSLVVESTRCDPEPKKFCQLSIYDFTALNTFKVLHEDIGEKTIR